MAFTSWRTPRSHGEFRRSLSLERFEPTRIFDNLSMIGDNLVCCFLLETGDGLVLLDSMWPENEEYIEDCIRKLGCDPAELKNLIITHGHLDHFGSAWYFQKKYGTKIWIGENDRKYASPEYEMYRESPPGKDFSYLTCRIDETLTDGQCLDFGGTRIHCFETPGHTPGCMSLVFQVFDEGRPHMASLWGGTGLPQCLEWRKDLLASCDRFAAVGLQYGCDAAISTHPFVDNGYERLQVLQHIVDGVANPFVLGYEGYHRFEMMYREMYAAGIRAREAEGSR